MATQNIKISRSKIHHKVTKKCKIPTDSSSTTIVVASFHVLFGSAN